MTTSTTTLWRPVGVYELRLIANVDFAAFPPRLPEQPIFYPVCNEAYAAEIARKWNPKDTTSGYAGFVTRFEVLDTVARRYSRHLVGARRHEELWVPAEDLADFCSAFVGPILVTHGWLGQQFSTVVAWHGALGEVAGGDLADAVALIARGELRGGL